jgi:2-polyprenyl-3-methyl-5-hydroxy-6-metoxy-1,4-benzoquinol methylase
MNNIYDNRQFFDQYSKMSRSQQGLSGAGEWHQFKALFPDLSGKSVLDLGCGYGWHCKYAVECGAEQVLGIDLSEKMIHEAKAKNADSKITYRVCGLEEYDYPANSYDCVVSNLVLHYIADIDAIFRKIYLTLKADGVFLLNIENHVTGFMIQMAGHSTGLLMITFIPESELPISLDRMSLNDIIH